MYIDLKRGKNEEILFHHGKGSILPAVVGRTSLVHLTWKFSFFFLSFSSLHSTVSVLDIYKESLRGTFSFFFRFIFRQRNLRDRESWSKERKGLIRPWSTW